MIVADIGAMERAVPVIAFLAKNYFLSGFPSTPRTLIIHLRRHGTHYLRGCYHNSQYTKGK